MGYTVRSEKGNQNYVNVTIGDKYEISHDVVYLGDNVLIHKTRMVKSLVSKSWIFLTLRFN